MRSIAKALKLSRNAVREVIRSGAAEVPALERDERLGNSLDVVRALYTECRGNLVRVLEKLADHGVEVGYSTLTAFCRRHEIGTAAKQVVGQYHFDPGEEMQHDTSPHTVQVGERRTKLQCASLVLCYSRAIFAQVYWRFSRLECRGFLSEGAQFFGGTAGRCMIDNTSVVISHGTGKDAVPAEAMRLLGERFGFYFEAHAVGDANRSARVERAFHYIENNFYAGRTFRDLADLNAQLRQWCIAVNNKPRRSLPRTPAELLAAERGALRPLPLHIPEVYEPYLRRTGTQGYITLHTNRYPVPDVVVGRYLDVHETVDRVRILDGHRLIAQYDKLEPGRYQRVPVPPELHRRGLRARVRPPSHEEKVLRAVDPVVGALVDALKKRDGGRAMRSMRWLHRMYLDYPTETLVQVVRDVERFTLIDLGRIEKLILKQLSGDFFRLPESDDQEDSS